jgi:hypothetical protein
MGKITDAGVDVEVAVVNLIDGELTTRNDPRGDAMLRHKGQVIFLEIKKKTLNQCRPNKYLTLVAFDGSEYYVIPPDDIMKLSVNRRGQHTPDSLTCVSLYKITNPKYAKYRVSRGDLRDEVIKAWEQGENNKALKNLAAFHRGNTDRFRIESQQLLKQAINN